MNGLLNELRKRKRSFIIQAITAINHSQTLLNDLKVNGDSDEDDIFDDKVDGRTLPRPGRSNLHGRGKVLPSTLSSNISSVTISIHFQIVQQCLRMIDCRNRLNNE